MSAEPTRPQQQSPLELPRPLSDTSNIDTEKFVVVTANDNATKFLCSKNGLVRFSKLYRALAQATDIEDLPLRCGAATPDVTALVCLWLNHYGAAPAAAAAATGNNDASSSAATLTPSRVSYPLQPGNSLSCFLNDWDKRFVETLLFKDGPTIAGNCGNLYSLAITATFLQAQVLVELCSGVFAFHIREAELASRPVQAPSGESVVRSWFGLSGDFNSQERQLILEQNRDLRDPQGILEKIKELSDEAHDTAAALSEEQRK